MAASREPYPVKATMWTAIGKVNTWYLSPYIDFDVNVFKHIKAPGEHPLSTFVCVPNLVLTNISSHHQPFMDETMSTTVNLCVPVN